MAPEPNAAQGGMIGSMRSFMDRSGARMGTIKSGGASMDVPHVKELADSIEALNGQIAALQTKVNSFSSSHIVGEYQKIVQAATAAANAGGAVGNAPVGVSLGGGRGSSRTPAPTAPFGGTNNPVVQGRMGWTTGGPSGPAAGGAPLVNRGAGGAPPAPPPGGSAAPPAGSPDGGHSLVSGMGVAYSAAGGGSAGLLAAGISGVMSGINKAADLLGALTSAGVQYTYNRIEGPTGNRNATVALSQSLAPLSATTGLTMNDLVKGLSQRTPALGSMSDIVGTALAGNAVGAQLTGTPNRNGFFQGVREMQQITPGIGASSLAGTLANYMGNTSSQQMGAFYGGGAFTMMGKGGRYKTLGEWAQGITDFFKQQRPGSSRGKDFTKAELMAQNFPGSNVNAWFQMMGVPSDMVDYWWQYVLTKANAGATGDGPFNLQGALGKQRGQDLGEQRLETITQASRRDFLMGTSMYGVYGVKEESDKRFNVAMQAADRDIASMATQTNVGLMMSMLPTSITDLLMPLLTKMAGSKIGSFGSMLGMMGSALSPAPPGDIGDVGDYGDYGGTSTAHMAPGLAKKIAAMKKANPNIKINSGYRDMALQRRLGKKGVGRVSGKPSAHTKGWAADLGPTDQLPWIVANAHKYGLQMATNQGEPWHAQEAGTMHVGDARQIGDWNDFIPGSGLVGQIPGLGPVLGQFGGMFEGGGDIFKAIIGAFLGGNTDTDSKINGAIAKFIQLMLMPTMGLADLLGSNSLSPHDVNGIIGKPTTISFNMPRYKGFESTPDPSSGRDIFGDVTTPTLPHLGRSRLGGMSIPKNMAGGGQTVIHVEVHAPVTIKATGSDTLDARRTAAVLEPHIEQAARRAVAAAGGRS